MNRKRMVGLSSILVAGLATGWALLPKPVAVEIAPVIRGPLTATVTAEGRSRVRDLYVVTAPVDGNLQRVTVEAGDSVALRGVVAQMAAPMPRPLDARSRAEAVAAVAVAEARQREAAAALTHAESLLATARTLRDVEARNTLEHAEHEVEIRRGAADAARAELARAEAVAGTGAGQGGASSPRTAIRSPVAGRVLRVVREDAGPVTAGTALLEIGNTTTLEFTADLLTADAMSVRAGAVASIRDWGPGPPLAARVRRVEPGGFTKVSALGLEEQRVRVVLDPAELPPPGLGNDFHVSVSIVVWKGENVVSVPSTALFRSGDHWAVFVIRGGRARLASVTPGPSDEVRTSIVEGISEGQEVIVQPSDLVRDGTRVKGT